MSQKENLLHFHSTFGAVAQLVERMNGIHEVAGSTPVSSTNSFYKLPYSLGEIDYEDCIVTNGWQ